MIEGTPARLLMLVRINRLIRLSVAYSSRYTAAATPTGNANRIVKARTHSEPKMAVRIPASSGSGF